MAENKYMDVVEDHEEEEGAKLTKLHPKVVGAPPWIVTFADLTTLMLTFFVLLLSFANMDVVKFRDMMGTMSEQFGSTKTQKGEFQMVAPVGSIAEKMGIETVRVEVDREREEQNQLSDRVADVARKTGMENRVQVFYGEDGISVRIADQVAFESGHADLKPSALPFLEGMAKITKSFTFNLVIEGHTDDIPIRTRQFPSNWELSTVRSTTVLRKLLEYGVPSDRLAAVGYADRKPIRENTTAEGRMMNRRVEFKFTRKEQES